jgi:hypothetical protein
MRAAAVSVIFFFFLFFLFSFAFFWRHFGNVVSFCSLSVTGRYIAPPVKVCVKELECGFFFLFSLTQAFFVETFQSETTHP